MKEEKAMKIEMMPQYKERYRNTRVFIEIAKETILENLVERHDRPHTQWRKEVLPKVFSQLNLPPDTKVRWSQYAGCTCPCSPGFILNISLSRQDIHVVIEGKESKAA